MAQYAARTLEVCSPAHCCGHTVARFPFLFYFTLFCFILDEVSYVAQAGLQLSHPAL